VSVFPTPDVPALTPVNSIDLVTDPPPLTIVGADPGDLETGGVSVAGGDFNGDGAEDILLGAPFGDGPGNSREDAGEAYVILGPRVLEGEVSLDAEVADLTIFGALAGDNLGFAVIGGDLNADGIDDVVVGAPGSNGLTNIRTDLGEAYVIFGAPSLGGAVDLAEIEQDFTFRPAEGFTRVGTAFAIGDINGDGIGDLIAGGPFGGRAEGSPPGSPRTTEGEVYVVFGAPDLQGEKDVARGEEDVRLKGSRELDGFGQSVASGDVNGDGVDDIILTAKRADGPDDSRTEAGEAYVFFGSAGLSGMLDSAEADITIYGSEEGDALGDVVASGDLNGDGLADILLSARFADGPENERTIGGGAYAIFGSASLSGVVDLADEQADVLVHGRDDTDTMPSAMMLADMDGDGRDDMVLGAAFADGPENGRSDGGEAYVLFSDALDSQVDLRTDVDDLIFIYGLSSGERLGVGLHLLDLDGDGGLELLLLAPNSRAAGAESGKLYVVQISRP
jgi:hypothetical protein